MMRDWTAPAFEEAPTLEKMEPWEKTVGSIRQVMVRELDKVNFAFILTTVAHNLTLLRNLAAAGNLRMAQ